MLDLACGDGLMAGPLAARGLRYMGVDASDRMIEAARRRNPGLDFVVARMEAFAPPEPVETTILLRTFYAVEDRVAFLRHVAGYTRGTFIFDFRRAVVPDPEPILRDLRTAGFSSLELRPFFLPQRRRLPPAVTPLLDAVERTGPLARAADPQGWAFLLRRFALTTAIAARQPPVYRGSFGGPLRRGDYDASARAKEEAHGC